MLFSCFRGESLANDTAHTKRCRLLVWRGGATYRLVTSMFCIKKQFEHLSLIIAARICSLALSLSPSLLLFHRATERLMHWMVKHFSRATLGAAKTQRHTKRTEDVCTGGTQDDLNIWMEFFASCGRNWLMNSSLFSLCVRTGGRGGNRKNFASLFLLENLHTDHGIYCENFLFFYDEKPG